MYGKYRPHVNYLPRGKNKLNINLERKTLNVKTKSKRYKNNNSQYK